MMWKETFSLSWKHVVIVMAYYIKKLKYVLAMYLCLFLNFAYILSRRKTW